MSYMSIDRESKLYRLVITDGRQLQVELHPNKTSGGFFRIASVEEGEALIERFREGIDALREARKPKDADVPVPPSPAGEGP